MLRCLIHVITNQKALEPQSHQIESKIFHHVLMVYFLMLSAAQTVEVNYKTCWGTRALAWAEVLCRHLLKALRKGTTGMAWVRHGMCELAFNRWSVMIVGVPLMILYYHNALQTLKIVFTFHMTMNEIVYKKHRKFERVKVCWHKYVATIFILQ
jgi:hypothetical protein